MHKLSEQLIHKPREQSSTIRSADATSLHQHYITSAHSGALTATPALALECSDRYYKSRWPKSAGGESPGKLIWYTGGYGRREGGCEVFLSGVGGPVGVPTRGEGWD